MPDLPILPDLSVVGAGKDALVDARPSAAPHVERGVWSHLFVGWRAQYGVARDGLAAEVNAARLPTSNGPALTELCQSNFDTSRGGAIRAIGELTISRTVVHVRADSGVLPSSDATDFAGITAFMSAFETAANAHLLSIYSSVTGLGSHLLADSSTTFSIVGTSTMGDLVSTANTWQTQWNRHVRNEQISDGSGLTIHTDPDTARVLTTSAAFASAGGSPYSSQSLQSQTSLLLVLNALRRAAVVHFGLEARGGTIRAGTRLSVSANTVSVPPVDPSDHTIVSDLYVSPGTKTVVPQTISNLTGTSGNLPLLSSGATPAIVIRDALFDSGTSFPFGPVSLKSAGGTAGQSDPLLRDAASASWRGSWGPTVDALLAGVLTSAGAARFAELDDPVTGTAYVYPADESWAQSDAWLSLVLDALKASEWSGVGQKVRAGTVLNTTIRVRMNVFLRDSAHLTKTDKISDGIKAALLSYFDDRPDWFLFRATAIGDVAAASDRKKILRVTGVVVTDVDGVPIVDPSSPVAGNPLYHWRFDDNALDATYLPPG